LPLTQRGHPSEGYPLAPSPRTAYARSALLWIGRIVGGIVGLAVAIFLAEVIFGSPRDIAALAVTAMIVVLGVFAGSRVALHFRRPS